MFGRKKLPGRTDEQLLLMREAGLLVGRTLEMLRGEVRPGRTTLELDGLAESFIRDHGGVPNFQLVPGYAHTLCTSVNDEVVHGIPGAGCSRRATCSRSTAAPRSRAGTATPPSPTIVGGDEAGRPEDLALSLRPRRASTPASRRWRSAAGSTPSGTPSSASIEAAAGRDGLTYGIIDEYVGHGIGRQMHLDPQIPNYLVRETGPKLVDGFTGAIEPMVTLGGIDTRVQGDDWTVVTVDGTRAAHWEHSVAVRADGLWILTAIDGGEAALAARGAAWAPIT